MSSGSSTIINFARYSGYESLAAAIVFTVLYSPLLLLFTKKVFSHPTYVHIVMALFCASTSRPCVWITESYWASFFLNLLVRVTAFIIRAVMIKVESAGENLGLLIGDQILFGIGYAGLLYSGYTLVLDLYVFFNHIFIYIYAGILNWCTHLSRAEEATRRSPPTTNHHEHHILRLLRNRHLFRIAMATAVTLGIIASSTVSSSGTSGPTATTLREASTAIFLALTALLFFQTIRLAGFNLSGEYLSQRLISCIKMTPSFSRIERINLIRCQAWRIHPHAHIRPSPRPRGLHHSDSNTQQTRNPAERAFLVPPSCATRNLGRDIVRDTRASPFQRRTFQEWTEPREIWFPRHKKYIAVSVLFFALSSFWQ